MGMATTFSILSQINLEKRNFKNAIKYCRLAQGLFGMINSPEVESIKLDLERIRLMMGNKEFEKITRDLN